MPGRGKLIFLILLAICCITTACAPAANISGEVSEASTDDDFTGDLAWHSCRFRMVWPENSKPDMDIDLFIAHSIVGPVVEEYNKNLPFWRFHRRAIRDDTGHQFSFLFYTNDSLRNAITKKIMASYRLEQLVQNKYIENINCNDGPHWTGQNIEDASDKSWSTSVQKNWPHYITGVSRLWLGLIEDAISTTNSEQYTFLQLVDEYRYANRKITETWQSQGAHAFIHHLNAIFGYENLLIRF